MKRYRVLADNDGHRYIIEVKDEEQFYRWVEASESDEGVDSNFKGKRDFDNFRINNSGWTFTNPEGWL